MEPVRYRPGEAVRWLQSGAAEIRKSASRQGKSLVRREGHRTIGKDLKQAAGVLVDMGKSAVAEIAHRQAMSSEYVLHDDYFEIVKPTGAKSHKYRDIRSITLSGERMTLELERGSLTIKPYAFIVSGRIKVPVGWVRNGMEVPYEVLLDELAARCGIDPDLG